MCLSVNTLPIGQYKETARQIVHPADFGEESGEASCGSRVNNGAFPAVATILVVEDEKMVRDVVVEMLQARLSVLETKHGWGR